MDFEALAIVSPHESVSIASLLHSIDMLLGLLQGDIHIAIDRLQLSYEKISKCATST